MRLQLAADISWSKRSASCGSLHLLIWKVVGLVFLPPTPLPSHGLALNWSRFHSFPYSSKDSFSPFTQTYIHTQTHTLTLTHSLPQMHVDSETKATPWLVYSGEPRLLDVAAKTKYLLFQGHSLSQRHLEWQRGQDRVSLSSSHISLPWNRGQFWFGWVLFFVLIQFS